MRNAALVRHCDLAINDGRTRGQLAEPFGYGRKPLRRVVARPAREAHYATLNRGDDAVAVNA
jgi:hypothetical protein